MYNNKLTELPVEIGDLKELRELSVSNNQLVGLPTSMQKLGELEKLYLYNNKLTELPAGIGDLKELRWLYVSGNPLNFDAIRFAQNLKNKGKFINTDIAGEQGYFQLSLKIGRLHLDVRELSYYNRYPVSSVRRTQEVFKNLLIS